MNCQLIGAFFVFFASVFVVTAEAKKNHSKPKLTDETALPLVLRLMPNTPYFLPNTGEPVTTFTVAPSYMVDPSIVYQANQKLSPYIYPGQQLAEQFVPNEINFRQQISHSSKHPIASWGSNGNQGEVSQNSVYYYPIFQGDQRVIGSYAGNGYNSFPIRSHPLTQGSAVVNGNDGHAHLGYSGQGSLHPSASGQVSQTGYSQLYIGDGSPNGYGPGSIGGSAQGGFSPETIGAGSQGGFGLGTIGGGSQGGFSQGIISAGSQGGFSPGIVSIGSQGGFSPGIISSGSTGGFSPGILGIQGQQGYFGGYGQQGSIGGYGQGSNVGNGPGSISGFGPGSNGGFGQGLVGGFGQGPVGGFAQGLVGGFGHVGGFSQGPGAVAGFGQRPIGFFGQVPVGGFGQGPIVGGYFPGPHSGYIPGSLGSNIQNTQGGFSQGPAGVFGQLSTGIKKSNFLDFGNYGNYFPISSNRNPLINSGAVQKRIQELLMYEAYNHSQKKNKETIIPLVSSLSI